MSRAAMLLALLVLLGGCAAASSPAPSGPTGPAALVEQLRARGIGVTELETFDPQPLGGRGTRLCVGGQQVNVYAFDTEQQRADVARRVDPNDPGKFGTMIIEWAGNPTFWQADRLIVLYLGNDPAVSQVLGSILGPPFASGRGMEIPSARHDC